MKKPNEDGRLFHLKKSSVCLHTPQSRIFTLFSEAGFYCSHLSQDFWSKFYNLCQSDNSGCSHILQLLSVVLGTFFFFLAHSGCLYFSSSIVQSTRSTMHISKKYFRCSKILMFRFSLKSFFYIYINNRAWTFVLV